MMGKTALLSCGVLLLAGVCSTLIRAEDAPTKTTAAKPADAAFETLKGLAGTWMSDDKDGKDADPKHKGMHNGQLVFKTTSGGSVVMETMFPGAEHEMVNMYHVDGDDLVITHYCAMGNQPTMALKKNENGALSFEFKSGGNMKSRDDAHMDAMTIAVAGDKLSEEWSFYQDGKVTSHETFHFTRQQEQK